jgi:hypothetical protein
MVLRVYKTGAYVTLCGAVLVFTCVCLRAQDYNLNIIPVDSSVHAGVDEIRDQSNEPLNSPKITKAPRTFSQWAPQAVKQLPTTTVWSGHAKAVDATILPDSDSDAVPQTKNLPKAITAWGVRTETKPPALENQTGFSSFNTRFQLKGNSAAMPEDDTPTRPVIFHSLPQASPSDVGAMPGPFGRNPFGRDGSLPFSTIRVFPGPPPVSQQEERPVRAAPRSHTPISPASKAKPTP